MASEITTCRTQVLGVATQPVTKFTQLVEHFVALVIVEEGRWSLLGRDIKAPGWALETRSADV
jgi:hypothetical protein